MKCHVFLVSTVCLSLFLVGTPASADIIIDENFDAIPVIDINSPVHSLIVTSMGMTAGMWWGGAPWLNMAWGVSMTHMATSNIPAVGMPGMVGGGWWSTLTYFAAQPAAGWGANPLTLSFEYDLDTLGFADGVDLLSPTTIGMYGVYGWSEGSIIPLQDPNPGFDGVELMSGALTPTSPVTAMLAVAGDTYSGDLTRFDYIGVTFTIGDPVQDFPQDEFLAVDNIRLSTPPSTQVIPEPATMGLAALAIAAVTHRLRRRKRA